MGIFNMFIVIPQIIAALGGINLISGLLGEKAQMVGKVAGAGMAAHEKGKKAEAAKAKGAKAEAFQKKQEAYYDKQLAKGKPKEKEVQVHR